MKNQLAGIEHRFTDPNLLAEALTHRSLGSSNYERLEFLGDSLLNAIVSARLFDKHPDATEGDLSRMRSRIVRGDTLARLAAKLDLGKELHLGESERKSGGRQRQSILADALEALIGALYLDAGFQTCRTIVLSWCDPLIDELPSPEDLKDPKTRLQEWLQARGQGLPVYRLESEEGADHAKCFYVSCSLPGEELSQTASGSSRRKAEQAAARALLDQLLAAPLPKL